MATVEILTQVLYVSKHACNVWIGSPHGMILYNEITGVQCALRTGILACYQSICQPKIVDFKCDPSVQLYGFKILNINLCRCVAATGLKVFILCIIVTRSVSR